VLNRIGVFILFKPGNVMIPGFCFNTKRREPRAERKEQSAEGKGQSAKGRGQRAEGKEQRAVTPSFRTELKSIRITFFSNSHTYVFFV
jgi:hypothetical protein